MINEIFQFVGTFLGIIAIPIGYAVFKKRQTYGRLVAEFVEVIKDIKTEFNSESFKDSCQLSPYQYIFWCSDQRLKQHIVEKYLLEFKNPMSSTEVEIFDMLLVSSWAYEFFEETKQESLEYFPFAFSKNICTIYYDGHNHKNIPWYVNYISANLPKGSNDFQCTTSTGTYIQYKMVDCHCPVEYNWAKIRQERLTAAKNQPTSIARLHYLLDHEKTNQSN